MSRRGAALRPFPWNSDRFAAAIADRLRSVLTGQRVELVAEQFGLPVASLRRLMERDGSIVKTGLLLDVVARLVHQWGIDPKWLLTGEYDGALHREALLLGEDRSGGLSAVRELVETEYLRLRSPHVVSLPSFRDIIARRAAD
jgi:hypothetical protein